MPDPREELIRLYSSYSVEQVVRAPEYQILLERNANNPQFPPERELVEQAKRRLEGILSGRSSSVQVREAIQELLRWRRNAKQALYKELIERGYKPHWNRPQQDYFDRYVKLLTLQYDFFLSFTTRYPPPPGENPVNSRFKNFIIRCLNSRYYRTADRDKKNLLAESVFRLLSVPAHVGFFFTHFQDDNALTEEKLREALENSIFFVQLVQNIMFQVPPGRKNYCFFEYQISLTAITDEKRLLFVVAEQHMGRLVPLFNVPPEYDDWYNHLTRKNPPYISEVDDTGTPIEAQALEFYVRDKLADQLDKFWNDVLASVPL